MISSPTQWYRGLLALVALPIAAWSAEPRLRENFDSHWRFSQQDQPGGEQPTFSDDSWRKVDLPHDWSIEGAFDEKEPSGGPGGYLPTGIGWYRKHFKVPEALRGRKILIQFDGVYMKSTVWINGHSLGQWPYGYTTFRYDLTPELNFGDTPNVIAVKVDNSQQPASRWYSGSGIYRHVWISAADPLQIVPDGVSVTTPQVSANSAVVQVQARINNGRGEAQAIELREQILTADGAEIASVPTVAISATVAAAKETELESVLTVPIPQLWSPETPNLYRLRTEIRVAGKIVDAVETSFGIRSIVYDLNRGLLLNGQPVKMLGMCLHHDGGAVGAAVPEGVLERRLRLLKAMGCNALRCSHNPPAPEFLDLCDRLGFLVMDEAFDEWTVRKPQIKFGYSDFFDAWHERDLVTMIHRDRNHPSVVMWSAGNEIGEQREPNGPDVLRKLTEIFHREDPTRPVTAAMDNIFNDDGPAPLAFTNLLDIAGYNYVDRWHDRRENFFGPDRSTYPERRFVGTEDQGLGGIRGDYEFRSFHPGFTERAVYADSMIRLEQLWKFALTHDYVIGHFMWTGFDYLGEARWPEKNASSGALDTCGFPKDSYYLYQSIFTTKPMLHLLPHWNWSGREGQVIPVIAYTNCDEVELFLNGRSLGFKAREFPRQGNQGGWNTYAKPPVSPTTADLHLSWDAPYARGTLKAIGYRNGQVVCSDEVHTADAPAALTISVQNPTSTSDGRAIAHLTIKVVDANGVIVPQADNQIRFEIDGPATWLGVDNGNPASHEPFKATERHAFNGLCLAIVELKPGTGKTRITAKAENLKSSTVELESGPPRAAASPLFTALP